LYLQLLRAGEIAPDFNLKSVEGEYVQLSSIKKPVALIFLRHLA
jgi:peroxiredoxin